MIYLFTPLRRISWNAALLSAFPSIPLTSLDEVTSVRCKSFEVEYFHSMQLNWKTFVVRCQSYTGYFPRKVSRLPIDP